MSTIGRLPKGSAGSLEHAVSLFKEWRQERRGALSSLRPSSRACTSSRRSKGSRWIQGRCCTASACSARTGSSRHPCPSRPRRRAAASTWKSARFDGTPAPAIPGGPYGADRLVEGLDYATALLDAMEAAGLPWLQCHPEYGASQFELSLAPGTPLEAADRMVHAKWLIQRLTRRFGWRCSFSHKPSLERVGNGGHLHLSMRRDGVLVGALPGVGRGEPGGGRAAGGRGGRGGRWPGAGPPAAAAGGWGSSRVARRYGGAPARQPGRGLGRLRRQQPAAPGPG
nr:hypothetical protein [Synechococcus sp. CCY 0621]